MKEATEKGRDILSGKGRVEVYTYPNMIIRVFIPDLTPEEELRRQERIKPAAEALILSKRKANEV